MYFAGFARVLAYFRPIDEDDATLRDPKQPEPLNSRMNKLRCECLRPAYSRPPVLSISGETWKLLSPPVSLVRT